MVHIKDMLALADGDATGVPATKGRAQAPRASQNARIPPASLPAMDLGKG